MPAPRTYIVLVALVAITPAGTADPPKKKFNLPDYMRMRTESEKLDARAAELLDKGETAEAIQVWEQAVAAVRPTLDFDVLWPAYPMILANLANACYEADDLDRAERAIRNVLDVLPQLKLPVPAERVVEYRALLGAILLRRGEFDPAALGEARTHLEQFVAEARKQSGPGAGDRARLALARALDALGRLADTEGDQLTAQRLQEEALTIVKEVGADHDADVAVLVANNLAVTLAHRTELNKAVQLLRICVEIEEGRYKQDPSRRATANLAKALGNLARTLTDLGIIKGPESITEAERLATRSIELTRRLGAPAAGELSERLSVMALLRVIRGQLETAEALARESLGAAEAAYPPDHPGRLIANDMIAFVLEQRRAWVQAVPFDRAILATGRDLANRFAGVAPENKAIAYAHSLYFHLPNYLYATGEAATPAAEVYGEVWQSKAALTRVYERRHAAVAAAGNPAAARAWSDLVKLRRKREQLLLSPSRLVAPAERDRRLAELAEDVAGRERDLATAMPTAARAAGAGGPADLRAALPPKAAFVDFVWYFAPGTERPKPYLPFTRVVPRYVAFVVRPDGIDRVELGPAGPIHAQLTAWLGAIDRGDPTTAPAAAMRELVWKPIAARLPADVSVVYLAPDNALARLPWAALPGARPDTILLEDHAVALVPHGPYLLDRLIAPAQADPFGGPVLTVGGVHYGDSKARDGGPPAWRPLPGTIREADTVVALADRLGISVVRLDGLGASRKRVEEELPKSRIAHLSTHGFFADPAADKGPDAALFARRQLLPVMPAEPLGEGAKNPLVRSGLVLADANRIDPPTAGLLTADGVLNLPLDHLDLAVLSACESGLGQAVTGEGVYGLQRAFHMAGAKNVLASLWKVDDEATTALMTLFYRNLWERKLSAVESLRLAQLSLCRRTDPLSAQTGLPRGAAAEGPAAAGFTGVQTTLPARRWAAFTVSGVGPVTGASPIALDEPNTRKSLSPIALWLGIAAAVLIAMAIILAACQRARQPAEKTSPRA